MGKSRLLGGFGNSPRLGLNVGAGPGGLTVANRLSASGSKQVLVLEAGLPNLNDPAILIPGYLGGTVGVRIHYPFPKPTLLTQILDMIES